MKTEYTPIACSVYDLLEAAAVKQTPLRIDFTDLHGTLQSRTVKVRDLFSKEKAEFLTAQDSDSGEILTLRLDTIRLVTDPATKATYSPTVC